MALDDRYIVASDLEQYFVDKDSGLPLAGGTLEFFSDVSRTTSKPVYQLSGSPPSYTYTSMGSVITLSAVGTVQNSGGDNEVIYYYPFDADGNLELYYVVCRDSNGIEQFSREAWPNISASDNPMTDRFPINNQIANPQFTQMFLNAGFATTFTFSSASGQQIPIAPDWTLVVSGTGSVTLQQIAIAGNQNIITSPPYVLDVTLSSGISQCELHQRFSPNAGLWSSSANEPLFLAGAYVAENKNTGTSGIQMFYSDGGGTPVIIVDGTFDNSEFVQVTGATATQLPLSTNSNSGTAGYIDIYLSFLPNSHVQVSSIQVVPTPNQAGGEILPYDLNSSNREMVNMGDYYLPNLAARPTPSFLVGWDFLLNPFQFGTTGTITTSAAYITDQTIAACGSTGNVNWQRNVGSGNSRGLCFTATGSNDAFYIMQYLMGGEARKILGTPLSVNVFGYQTNIGNPVTMRVYLFRAASSTLFPTLPTSIGTLASTGIFTVDPSTHFPEIPRSGLDTAKANLPYSTDISATIQDIGFTGWEVVDPSQIAAHDKVAMVVTFAYVDTNTQFTINSISLTPGNVPCRPAPMSFDEVFRQCEHYYEKSYPLQTPEATVSSTGQISISTGVGQSGGNDVLSTKSFTVNFKTIKRTTPTVRMYSPSSATTNQVQLAINVPRTSVTNANVSIANWSSIVCPKNISFGANNSTVNVTSSPSSPVSEGLINFQYAADARLGIV